MIITNDAGLTVGEVAERLGVTPATVYAYVSRGSLTRRPGPDGRTSRYEPDEVELLARRSRPRSTRRTAAAVDVVIGTTISEIGDGWIRYRGLDLTDLAGRVPFEAVAELLWTGELAPTPEVDAGAAEAILRAVRRTTRALPADAPVSARLAVGAATASGLLPAVEDDLTTVGLLLVGALVEALPVVGASSGRSGPTESIAARLWPRISPLVPTPARVAVLDTALVLLAEHELATSTLAVRVAASTRANAAEAVTAGLGTVSGSLHGRAAVAVHQRLLGDTASLADDASAGTGHQVHRGGDPRFPILADAVAAIAPAGRRARIEADLARLAEEGAAAPNVDASLGALGFVAGAEPGVTEAIFAIARTAGWLAHAFEEYDERPLRFRGRTLYRGPA